METVQQILTRVDKLSKSRPVSEKEYLAAIKKALTSVEKKLAKTKGRWTRRRMDAIIVQLRRELKSPTRKFIESFFDDMLSAIWADYKKGISQYDEDMTLYELDKESVENVIGFRSIAFERMNAAGKRIPYSVDVDEFLKSVDVDTAKKVKSAIVSGAVTGVNPNEAAAQAARIISEVRGIKSKEAANLRTVVRTMYADAQNRVHMQFLEDNQHIYDYFEYVAKLDNRTTEMCRYMDEKEWAFFDDIPKELMPPLHPNCRSIIVGMIKDQETQTTTKTAAPEPTVNSVKDIPKPDGVRSFVSENEEFITVSKIITNEEDRGEGKATTYMNDIIAYAETVGKTVALTPSSDFGGDKALLIEWYTKLGFVENAGSNKDYGTQERYLYIT